MIRTLIKKQVCRRRGKLERGINCEMSETSSENVDKLKKTTATLV